VRNRTWELFLTAVEREMKTGLLLDQTECVVTLRREIPETLIDRDAELAMLEVVVGTGTL
jgi:hypothetical protein